MLLLEWSHFVNAGTHPFAHISCHDRESMESLASHEGRAASGVNGIRFEATQPIRIAIIGSSKCGKTEFVAWLREELNVMFAQRKADEAATGWMRKKEYHSLKMREVLVGDFVKLPDYPNNPDVLHYFRSAM